MSAPEVIVVKDVATLADRAAARIEQVALAQPPGGRATIALAGGSTPKAAYQQLAARCPPWGRVTFFFGDERCVPPEDAASNYNMAKGALLDRIPLRPDQVHRISGELPPEEAAARAEEDVRAFVPGSPYPVFDLVLLGMGADGHTASLFPGSAEVEVTDRLMVPVHRPDLPQPWRVSLTLPVINAARQVLMLVGDGAKAPMVRRAVGGDPALPAGRLDPAGRLVWLVTEDAARDLPAREDGAGR
ncbi:MAG TPA: 6-phosphogluconolactonase [Miltoncostaeaceae bacterium]|nr:6-phosphogluconolactonase [Miltoncostaeaceae bacterium]